jgi:mycothiol synthase
MGEKKAKQLQMVWPKRLLKSPPEIVVAEGYELRVFQPGDEFQYLEVTHAAGFENWDLERLRKIQARCLPDGLFVIEHLESGQLVATALAQRNTSELHPEGGELGWVAARPEHGGKGLGLAVCAAATRRFLEDGFEDIYLQTDDWRLAALKVYLKLGYEPFLFAPDMKKRWTEVCRKLDWDWRPA